MRIGEFDLPSIKFVSLLFLVAAEIGQTNPCQSVKISRQRRDHTFINSRRAIFQPEIVNTAYNIYAIELWVHIA